MDCHSELIVPLIERAFSSYPNLSVRELMPIVLDWYNLDEKPEKRLSPSLLALDRRSGTRCTLMTCVSNFPSVARATSSILNSRKLGSPSMWMIG
jgi:hypothetical protein